VGVLVVLSESQKSLKKRLSMSNPKNNPDIQSPWAKPSEDILQHLEVDPRRGLSREEVSSRIHKYGRNLLREKEKKSAWSIFLDQFKNLIILLLALAFGLSLAFGKIIEGIAVLCVIVINTLIGFFTEMKAVRSMEALQEISQVDAVVRREGKEKTISARELVPGDIVVLQGGDIVTADVRIIQASKLQASEATLTGESTPVSKSKEPVDSEAPLAERSSMLFKGTAVARGSAEGVVVATGQGTELGQISDLVEEAKEEVTPLEQRLNQLGRRLIWVFLGLTAAIAATGIGREKDAVLLIKTAVTLAVAAIPEGLPIVATIALAQGMWRMARRNALINKLGSVETLGATSIICADKTGTLTLNNLSVEQLRFLDNSISFNGENHSQEEKNNFKKADQIDWKKDSLPYQALLMGVLCSNASLAEEGKDAEQEGVGDPLEVALLQAGKKADLDRQEVLEKMPERREEAFDSRSKMMATFHETDQGYLVAVKGAPETVVEDCTRILSPDGEQDFGKEEKKKALEISENMAEQGLKVLAVARRRTDSTDVNPYEQMTFLGVFGFLDPPREEIRQSLEMTRKAGIRTIMVTGDQPQTAKKIALEIKLCDADKARVLNGKDLPEYEKLSKEQKEDLIDVPIFARVSPEQKLDIIALHQDNQSIVAMTGDGVNDAPALKKADIGIAMGRRGTQVAREASDMILKDDAFSTIYTAVKQGRVIFNNIRIFLIYLLSCNVSEMFAVGIASLANLPLPLLPLQILFLNMVTEIFPALALGVGEGEENIMEQPPRSSGEALLARPHWLMIVAYGTTMALTTIAALVLSRYWLGADEETAVSISFLTLAFAQVWHVFNMRSSKSPLFINAVTRNRSVWMAVLLCIVLIFLAAFVPILSQIFSIEALSLHGWLIAVGMSLVPPALVQIVKLIPRTEK
jgi:P-type Ca2+ transporter type 2C